MPVKVKCTGCEKVLSVPDAARGKAVKCPACQTRIAVPAEAAAKKPAATRTEGAKTAASGSKTKKPARSVDSEEALLSLDMRRAEDTNARVCVKCGFDMKWQDEEDNECPQCGFDSNVGGMGVKAKKKSMKGPDPADFYPGLVGQSWKFVRKNLSLAIRSSVYSLISLTIGLTCVYLYLSIYLWPPRVFLAMVAILGFCIIPGWMWVLDIEVLKLTLERKDKFKRLNFDLFLSSAMGLAFVIWCGLFVAPLMLLPAAVGWLIVRAFEGSPEIVYPVCIGIGLIPVISMMPVVMAHMAMPVAYRGWMFWSIIPIWFKNIRPLMFWLMLFMATNLPTIAGLGTVAALYAPTVQEIVLNMEKNADINRELFYAKENPNARKLGQRAKEPPKVEDLKQIDLIPLIVPAVILVVVAIVNGFTGLFNMRTHGQFVYFNKSSLNLIDKRKEYKYVARKTEDELLEEEAKPKTTQQLVGDSIAFFLIFTLLGGIGGMVYGFSTTFGMLGGILYGLDFGIGLGWLAVNKEIIQAAYRTGWQWGLIANFVPFGSIGFVLQNLEERRIHLIRILVGWAATVLIVGMGLALLLSGIVTTGPPVSRDHEDIVQEQEAKQQPAAQPAANP